MQAIPAVEPFISYSSIPHPLTVVVDLPPLVPDTYYVTAWVGPHNLQTYDTIREATCFEINQSPTPGRTFRHTHDHGMLVPISTLQQP